MTSRFLLVALLLPLASVPPDGVRSQVAEFEFVVDETGTPVLATGVILNATTLAYAAAKR